MKTHLLVALSLLLVSVANAQHHPHWGFKGGLNLSDLIYEGNTNPDIKPSVYLGALAHVHLSRHFALQPELYFSAQGASFDANPDYKINLSYINLPILVQFMAGTGFRLQTGPQIGGLLSAKNKKGNTSTDIKDNLNKIDFSWAFGASYVSNSGLGFDARYNLGISNVNENNNNKIRNSVIQLGLFYQLRVSSSDRRR